MRRHLPWLAGLGLVLLVSAGGLAGVTNPWNMGTLALGTWTTPPGKLTLVSPDWSKPWVTTEGDKPTITVKRAAADKDRSLKLKAAYTLPGNSTPVSICESSETTSEELTCTAQNGLQRGNDDRAWLRIIIIDPKAPAGNQESPSTPDNTGFTIKQKIRAPGKPTLTVDKPTSTWGEAVNFTAKADEDDKNNNRKLKYTLISGSSNDKSVTTDTGSASFLSYAHSQPGTYSYKVKVEDASDSSLSNETTVIPITINKKDEKKEEEEREKERERLKVKPLTVVSPADNSKINPWKSGIVFEVRLHADDKDRVLDFSVSLAGALPNGGYGEVCEGKGKSGNATLWCRASVDKLEFLRKHGEGAYERFLMQVWRPVHGAVSMSTITGDFVITHTEEGVPQSRNDSAEIRPTEPARHTAPVSVVVDEPVHWDGLTPGASAPSAGTVRLENPTDRAVSARLAAGLQDDREPGDHRGGASRASSSALKWDWSGCAACTEQSDGSVWITLAPKQTAHVPLTAQVRAREAIGAEVYGSTGRIWVEVTPDEVAPTVLSAGRYQFATPSAPPVAAVDKRGGADTAELGGPASAPSSKTSTSAASEPAAQVSTETTLPMLQLSEATARATQT